MYDVIMQLCYWLWSSTIYTPVPFKAPTMLVLTGHILNVEFEYLSMFRFVHQIWENQWSTHFVINFNRKIWAKYASPAKIIQVFWLPSIQWINAPFNKSWVPLCSTVCWKIWKFLFLPQIGSYFLSYDCLLALHWQKNLRMIFSHWLCLYY